MWTIYEISWTFPEPYRLCGSVPSNPMLIKGWGDARKPEVKPPNSKSIEEIQEEVFSTLPEEPLEVNGLIFQRHPQTKALVVRCSTIKAHIKDNARILGSQYIGKIKGEGSWAQRVISTVYPDPATYWVPILRPDGTPMMEPDGEYEKPVHAMGPRGPINALKRFEFISPARIDFRLQVLGVSSNVKPKDGEAETDVKRRPAVSKDDLETLFTYGGVKGYGGERGDGEGKYLFTITKK